MKTFDVDMTRDGVSKRVRAITFGAGDFRAMFWKQGETQDAEIFFNMQKLVDAMENNLVKKIEDILAIRWNSEKEQSTPDYEDMEFYMTEHLVVLDDVDDWWDVPKSALPALKALGLKGIKVWYKGDREEVEITFD